MPNYRIEHQAKESGYFDTISMYDQTNTPGIQDHAEFINSHPRGYGNQCNKQNRTK